MVYFGSGFVCFFCYLYLSDVWIVFGLVQCILQVVEGIGLGGVVVIVIGIIVDVEDVVWVNEGIYFCIVYVGEVVGVVLIILIRVQGILE